MRQIKKRVRSIGWKIQKFTSRRLQMGGVFGCGHVSFDENPRTTVHCVIAYKHLHHDCICKKDLYYLLSVWLNILFKTKMTRLFCKFRIVDMLDIWLNKENNNFDWFKFVWLKFLLVYNVNVILCFGIWLCYWPRISNSFGCNTPYWATWKCSSLYFLKFLDTNIVLEGPQEV